MNNESGPSAAAIHRKNPKVYRKIRQLCQVCVRATQQIAAILMKSVLIFVVFAIGVIVVCTAFVTTPRNVAFRNEHPGSPACLVQHEQTAALTAARGSETAAVAASRPLKFGFRCSLQEHTLTFPAADWSHTDPRQLTRSYHLAFLEFAENGSPYVLRHGPDNHPTISQLDAIRTHLASHRPNYVIVFIHGWRHDARVGDGNVADLHLQLAHATSFLFQRCIKLQRDCNATVTGIYVGWRGARVDERVIVQLLGQKLGEFVSNIVVAPTLFDRKPVSEAISPYAVGALKGIADGLQLGQRGDRMLVLGHSLGGNLLISALSEPVARAVSRHPSGTVLSPPVGSLVVLLNPAAEAAKWTRIQRSVLDRFEMPGDTDDVAAGQGIFPPEQPPALISLTAAETWPAGGIRREDCENLERRARLGSKPAARILNDIRGRKSEFNSHPVYDFATYDLFPAFKGDLRPLALTLDRYAARLDGHFDLEETCSEHDVPDGGSVAARAIGFVANALRNAPFMNTDAEQTHTIGHLDPPRPPSGMLASFNPRPFRRVGTTHELLISASVAKAAQYEDATDSARSACESVDGWLRKARGREPPYGLHWDSGYTHADGRPGNPSNVTPIHRAIGSLPAIESQFRHGLLNSGQAPIVRGNDPFWNVRAFDTALAEHGGYTSFPLICVLNQLVMDGIVSEPAAATEQKQLQ